jgi:hypothetical protein
MGHDGRGLIGEQTEQIFYEVARKKRHVTSGDEDDPVPGGEESGLDADERPLAAGTQVGNMAGFGESVPSPTDEEDLRAAGSQDFVDPVEESRISDLQR